jgi:hypothetical protein
MKPSVSDEEIDEAIVALLQGNRQRKVAFVVGTVGTDLIAAPNDAFFERVAGRIEWLCENGKLEGFGNLKRWRHSEVRLPPL